MKNESGNRMEKIKGDHGFSMVEVLIALVILAIGLLGLAGLQIRSLQGSHAAYVRSQGTIYVNDIIERMRANRVAALAGNYNIAFTAFPTNSLTIAGADVTQWKNDLAALPLGDGSIQIVGTDVTVIVQWDDNRSGIIETPGEQMRLDTQL